MNKIDIRISVCFKKIVINSCLSINYDYIDMSEFGLFIWKNNEIVGSMLFTSLDKYTFEIVSKCKYEVFHNYEDAKEYLIKNNLVK